MGSISQSNNEKSTTYTFSDINLSPQNYIIYAELISNGTVQATSPPVSIDISFQKFNYIKLSMVNDELWPHQNSPNYDAAVKAAEAFGDANVILNTVDTKPNLSNTTGPDGNPLDLSSQPTIIRWAVWHAYGSPNPPNINLKEQSYAE